MLDLTQETVMVTGASGFLGGHVLDALERRGVLRSDVFAPSHERLDLTYPHRGDDSIILPTVIIHLAAKVGGIQANAERPGEYFRDNMLMGINIADMAVTWGAKLVVVGTTCSYPSVPPVPIHESSLFDGQPHESNRSYGIAKRALLQLLRAYRDQYGLHSAYVIPANLYGPGDNYNPETSHVIPAMIRKVAEAKASGGPVTFWGDGHVTREFLYAPDCAEGVVRAAERLDSPLPVNLGTGLETSIAGLAEMICRLMDYHGEVVWDAGEPAGQERRCLDVQRAETMMGWQAATTLQKGLAATIAVYEGS